MMPKSKNESGCITTPYAATDWMLFSSWHPTNSVKVLTTIWCRSVGSLTPDLSPNDVNIASYPQPATGYKPKPTVNCENCSGRSQIKAVYVACFCESQTVANTKNQNRLTWAQMANWPCNFTELNTDSFTDFPRWWKHSAKFLLKFHQRTFQPGITMVYFVQPSSLTWSQHICRCTLPFDLVNVQFLLVCIPIILLLYKKETLFMKE